jgi:anti-anti-sigma factor
MIGSEATVTAARRGVVTVLTLAGEIDIANAADVGERIGALVDGGSPVVADLAAVAFMDSQALALLDRLAERLDDDGLGFAIVAPTSSVPRRVLELVDLGIPLFERVDAACAALAGPPEATATSGAPGRPTG